MMTCDVKTLAADYSLEHDWGIMWNDRPVADPIASGRDKQSPQLAGVK